MSQKVRRKQRQAVGLLDQAVRCFKKTVQSRASYKPNTDTSVTTFERYVKRLEKLIDVSGAEREFWFLHQKVYIRLVKQTLKLRD
jgi:hypothetical protein